MNTTYLGRQWLSGALLLAALMSSCAGTVEVREKPVRPNAVVVRPPQPSPRHIWIEEDWRPSGRTYVYRGGYWAAPPRASAVWVPGHWQNTRRGFKWVPGHWK